MQLFIITIIALFLSPVPGLAMKEKNKLEELIIWKMSDEMKLNSVQEQKFSALIRKINKDKSDLNVSLQQSLKKMSVAASSKVRSQELKNYALLLKKFNDISEGELREMQVILGVDKTVEYLLLKQDIASRIKNSLLSGAEAPVTKELPAPKIIEQK